MKITLDYEEIKYALAKALEEKTGHIFGLVNQDDCYFNGIENCDDYGKLEFSVEVN